MNFLQTLLHLASAPLNAGQHLAQSAVDNLPSVDRQAQQAAMQNRSHGAVQGGGVGQQTARAFASPMPASQNQTGLTDLNGQPTGIMPQGTSSLLRQLSVMPQTFSQNQPQAFEDGTGVNLGRFNPQQLNLGSPDYMSDPQGGFGPQVQQLGSQGYQTIQPAPYNQGPQNLGHQNPQLKDNGYFWYQ